jgi:hypothetical protein
MQAIASYLSSHPFVAGALLALGVTFLAAAALLLLVASSGVRVMRIPCNEPDCPVCKGTLRVIRTEEDLFRKKFEEGTPV